MSIEQKLLRLQEIHQVFEQKKITLEERLTLLKEAYKLKSDIEVELKKFENEFIKLEQSNQTE